jgi:signal transduction histidine kinase
LQFEGLNEPMLSVVVPWGKDENLYGGIVLHSPVNGIEETISKIREAVLWVTLIGLLASIIMVSYSSWSLTRPLHKLARVAAEISLGNYRIRMEDDLPEEFEDLVSMINAVGAKLEQMDEEKRKSEQTTEDLLANISHELRTPLTAIRGFLEALQDNLIPEEGRKKYYDLMYNEMLYMNRLVDDLLDLLKLDKNDIVLSLHPLDLKPILEKVAFAFTPAVQEKGLQLHVNLADTLPKVAADVDRLEQIVSNLLKNAIKFTDQGSITLSAFEENRNVVIEVEDTGCGISETDQQRIWERFFKADRGRSRQNKGAGLGLAIVKELVEMHNGSITVKSHLEQGTTFRITFPLQQDHKMFTNAS